MRDFGINTLGITQQQSYIQKVDYVFNGFV